MLKFKQRARPIFPSWIFVVFLLFFGTVPAVAQNTPSESVKNECLDLSWVRPATLHRLLNSPVLEPLAKAEINTPIDDNRNSFSWCLVGELLQWLRVMKPEDPRKYDRADYRSKVWDALYLLSFNVLEGETFEPETITSSLNLKFADRFGGLQQAPKIDKSEKPGAGTVPAQEDQEKAEQNSSKQSEVVSLDILTQQPTLKPAVEPETLPDTGLLASKTVNPLGLKQYLRSASLKIETDLRSVGELPNGCRPLSSFKTSTDPDVRKYAREFESLKICYRVRNIVESNTRWVLQVFENLKMPSGPTWFLPHDDSDTAFDAAVYALGKFGGRIVAVHSNEKRQNSGVDANQLFGTTKTEVAECPVAKERPSPELSVFVYKLFPSDSPVFMINNNDDEGAVTAASSSERMTGALANGDPVSSDADDFIRLAGKSDLGPSDDEPSALSFLQDSGFNVVYQTIPRAGSDCSFANFAALRDRAFFSIETEHGHLEEQKAMIDKLIAILRKM